VTIIDVPLERHGKMGKFYCRTLCFARPFQKRVRGFLFVCGDAHVAVPAGGDGIAAGGVPRILNVENSSVQGANRVRKFRMDVEIA